MTSFNKSILISLSVHMTERWLASGHIS